MLPIQRDSRQIEGDGYPMFSSDEQAKLVGLFVILRRRRISVVLSLILTVGLVGAYTMRSTPVYQASSVLRFELQQVNLPQLVMDLSTLNRIGTEMQVLQGRSAAVAVIDSLGLRAVVRAPRRAQASAQFAVLRVSQSAGSGTLELRPGPDGRFSVGRPNSPQVLASARIGDTVQVGGVTLALLPAMLPASGLSIEIVPLNQAVADFLSALRVSRPATDADLVAVRIQGGDPIRVAAAANLLAEQLISGRERFLTARTGTNVAFLQTQLDTLSIQLHGAEEALRSYQQRAGVVDVDEQAHTQVGRLAQLQADRGAVEAEQQALAALLHQMDSDSARAAANGGAVSRRLISFPTLFRSQAASELLGSLAQVENERSTLLTRRTAEDPDVLVLTTRVREIDAQLRGTAEAYLQGLTNQVASLAVVAKRFGGALDSLPEKQVRMARLEREVRVQQELYTLIQTRLKTAEITQAMDDPTVRIVDRAVVPASPVRPKPVVNLTLALLLGSLIGVGIAFVREMADRSVRSRADATEAAGLPILGAIPRLRSGRRAFRRSRVAPPPESANGRDAGTTAILSRPEGARIARMLVTQPHTPAGYVESFNQLHANLALGFHDQPRKVLVITSPLPREGKTLTAANFALTLAGRGERVLLIDGDLRCGTVNEVFGVPSGPGFADLLQETARFEEVARRVLLADGGVLTILTAGTPVAAPGRLLVVERVRDVLAELSPQFDSVIIDSPPVNLLADAALLGAAADAVLLVVRAGRTRADTLRYAMEQLTAARAPVIGTLLNDIDPRRHGYDDDSYRYLTEVERYVAADGGRS